MKHFQIIVVLLLALLSSCDLTLLPEDKISPDIFFSSAQELELWTNQFYTIMDGADAAASQSADDNVSRSMGAVISGTRSAADESGWTWTRLRAINYCLQNMDHCTDNAAKTRYTAVCYFFRAYFYFQKVQRYGNVPWYDQVLKSTDDLLLYKVRDDRGFVMDKVMEDLDNAVALFSSLPPEKSISRVTKWTALAFKSRAALYEGTFRKYHGLPDADKYLTQAANAAADFIDNSGYTLYSDGAEPYRDLFCSNDAQSGEVVLARLYNFTDLNISHSVQFNISNNQQGFTRRYMNHYLMKDGTRFTDKNGYETMTYPEETADRDPRMAQTVLCPGYIQKGNAEVSPNTLLAMTGYQPIKFVADASQGGSSKGYVDWPLFRTAEVYLNYAEAKAELGDITPNDLEKSVNRIRARAKMPKLEIEAANATIDPFLLACYPHIDKSNEANRGLILEIRRERTVEMVMEGQRQWDMFRWHEGAQLVNKTNKYFGCYIPAPGLYDMSGDGTPDVEIYETNPTSNLPVKKKIGSDIFLSNGASGYITAWPSVEYTWDETRDYLWPLPSSEIILSNNILTQNPKW
ncbi:MAG: RagB/SusD family nutrient uptake outer membrane protein [Dysgonamonadaceae bacterium]|jgi:hypothetical protein|nr:RagB/SusD family nutrient uptake outer membrane protein [Dysgonamonadaceae bacterium]